MLQDLLHNPVCVLFLIIAIGYLIGAIKVLGFSLGSSAVLFVALAFGHFGQTVPKVLADLGVILFVYSVGLQAGPRFFKTFRDRGVMFAQIGLIVILTAATLAWAAARWLDLPPPLAMGVFAGALTSTPGLAAAVDTLNDTSVSVGYGIAYPFGVVGVVLFVQIIPRLLKNGQAGESESSAASPAKPKRRLRSKQYRVENPQCDGKTLAELDFHSMTSANISRVWHQGAVTPALRDSTLHVGDVVLAVGAAKELAKLVFLLGPEVDLEGIFKETENVIARDVFVTEGDVAGKTIGELQINERFGVVITRVWREDFDMVPTGKFRLEIGDLLRCVGRPEDCEVFEKSVGQHEIRIHETTILPFSLGVVLGVIVGMTPIPLPGGITARLGLAGGPLLVGLLLGYFRGLWGLRLRTPYAVRYLLRELGVVFFLAGAGTNAGEQFLGVLQEQGGTLVLTGAVVTLVPMVLAFFFTRYVYKLDTGSALGTVCGSMTSTPGLGAVCANMDAEEPTLAYATVYPVALIAVTVAAQVLSILL